MFLIRNVENVETWTMEQQGRTNLRSERRIVKSRNSRCSGEDLHFVASSCLVCDENARTMGMGREAESVDVGRDGRCGASCC